MPLIRTITKRLALLLLILLTGKLSAAGSFRRSLPAAVAALTYSMNMCNVHGAAEASNHEHKTVLSLDQKGQSLCKIPWDSRMYRQQETIASRRNTSRSEGSIYLTQPQLLRIISRTCLVGGDFAYSIANREITEEQLTKILLASLPYFFTKDKTPSEILAEFAPIIKSLMTAGTSQSS